MTSILIVAAHPDEPEIYAGGTAALLARHGHRVKFLTLTNGDAGHQLLDASTLARRRADEAQVAAAALGVEEYEIFDIGDGLLATDIPTRLRLVESIRRWAPDVLISLPGHGPGHPDNRAAGRLVEEAAALLTLRNVLPEIAPIAHPYCLTMPDYAAAESLPVDVAVAIDSVLDAKIDGCLAHASQFLEFAPSQRGILDLVPADADAQRAFVLEHWAQFFEAPDRSRGALAERYDEPLASNVRYAEWFAVAPYSRAVDETELRQLLPVFPPVDAITNVA